MPRSNGSIGSTTAACWSRSATCHRPKPKRPTTGSWRNPSQSLPESNETASEEVGTVHTFYQDPTNLTPAVALMERAKIYPLGRGARAKPMQYPDASGVPVDMLPISDAGAFDQLKLLVDSEGNNLADPDWRGMLAALGIVKGQPFNADARTRAILDRAAKTAYKM